jgi:outer membrane protein OmpA-like peptidoglycan-associated protein
VPRRNIQISMVVILLACGLLLSVALDHARFEELTAQSPLAPLQNPSFTVSSGRGRLLLAGTTASADHERSLLRLANEQFAGALVTSDFAPGVITPDDWIPTSNRLLYALAATESAYAVMQPGSIQIRAVSSDAEALAERLDSLRETAGADTNIDSDVITVDSTTSFEQLCTQTFSQLLLEPISFAQSSHELRTSSFVTLDRLTDFASDCQHVKIAITGHTDGSGDESWNRQLSLARAQAVADYIARGGIDPQRMLVQGVGSSVPVSDDTTAQGRALNRRIEIELR